MGLLSAGPGRRGIIISFLILIISIAASILCQHYIATRYINQDGWNDDCPPGYEDRCKQNSSVFRFSMSLVVLFASQAIGVSVLGVPMGNQYFDNGWLIKFLFYTGVLVGFYFLKSTVFGDKGYAWFARIVGGIFVVYQQIILIDCAYRWNELWVEYSNKSGSSGGMDGWLAGLLAISLFLTTGSLAAIGVMFWQFSGCSETTAIMALTICLSVVAMLIQVFLSETGSLLTSSIVFAYATFICYSSVSLNPRTECNPTIATSFQTLTEILGILFTVAALSWTSLSAIRNLVREDSGQPNFSRIETGTTTTGPAPAPANISTGSTQLTAKDYAEEGIAKKLQQVNLVFILISCYYAMVLTDWATIQAGKESADPKAGDVAMWIQAATQWTALLLYIWTLIAPTLFPDRDFS